MKFKRNKRVLWLLNHTTLREFEVPLLEDLGFEVFVPKLIPLDEANRSADITYEYDSKLSIPKEKLLKLNEQDFYSHGLVGVEDIANDEFDFLFCGFFPEQIKNVISCFNGLIFLRVFGLAGDSNYTDIIKEIDLDLYNRLCKIKNRFFFAQAYSHLAEVEYGLFREKACTLKLSLPESITNKLKDNWSGTNKKLFTVCPRIKSSPAYYGKIYEEMKDYFSSLPWIVAGAQPSEVEDERVLGFVTRDKLNDLIIESAVMFYHSVEPRHLHFHPIEALIAGQPLIFMNKGLLGSFASYKLPGACDSYDEAVLKIKRILNEEKRFIDEVCSAQKKLLKEFDPKMIRMEWESEFIKIEKRNNFKTIVFFMPISYRGGTLNASISTIRNLQILINKNKLEIKILLSIPYDNDYELDEFKKLDIEIIHTKWVEISRNEMENIRRINKYNGIIQSSSEVYFLPTDEKDYFQSCDHWVIVSDRSMKPIAPIKPYTLIVFDYIQRYEFELYEALKSYQWSFMYSVRNAERILVTTKQTGKDVNNYAGAKKENIFRIPMYYQAVNEEKDKKLYLKHCGKYDEYIIWTTNGSSHKNQERTLKAYEYYKKNLSGGYALMITGVDTNKFSIGDEPLNSHINTVYKVYDDLDLLTKKNIKLLGEIPRDEYISLLSNAKFLLHSCVYDNGTFSLVEAQDLGVPCLSSRYPQINEMVNTFNLEIDYFDSSDIMDLALKLKEIENEIKQGKKVIRKRKCSNLNNDDILKNAFNEVIFG